jgi:DNA-binding NtrC family response regulator
MSQPRLLEGAVVLVVEDDAEALASVTNLIANELGCHALSALSAAHALAILDSGVKVDIILSDVVMPGMDGVALAKAARERFPALPVVLATGWPRAVDLATDAGAIPLIKPYSLAQLEAVLMEGLRPQAQ